MNYPNFSEERKLWKQGYEFVVGLDEAGRGPLAGPVVAAAIVVDRNHNIKYSHTLEYGSIGGIRDSKKLSAKQREHFYKILTNHKDIKWSIGMVSEKVIDKINILEATKLAMQKALKNLNFKFQNSDFNLNMSQKINNYPFFENTNKIDFLLIDGNFRIQITQSSSKTRVFAKADNSRVLLAQGIPMPPGKYNKYSLIPCKSIVKGDEKIFSISAASIIAKVTRDRIMQKFHKKYPNYGFDLHKGYGTTLHVKNLKNFGPCKIHRKTFHPVKNIAHTLAP